jgi:cell division protein FtsQ
MSSTAKIKRGSNPARKRTVVKPRKTSKRAPTAMARVMAAMPVSQIAMQRAGLVMLGVLGLAAAYTAASFLGLPQLAGHAMAEAVGRAGFTVKRVEVVGLQRMERMAVYDIVLGEHSTAMPLVDLDKVRDNLLQFGWIKDARVSRRFPDTLVVDIVERTPAAVWQNKQQLSLIDATGVILEPVQLNAMPDLPLVIGPDANSQATALQTLMTRAPALKPMLAGATWVGNRRWDLRFQSGEVLALPEGDAEGATAIAKFATLDRAQRLLGRGFERFDMRDPTKFVVRVARAHPAIDAPGKDQKVTEKGGAQHGTTTG